MNDILRRISVLIGLSISTVSSVLAQNTVTVPFKPNIIFILSDDLGYADLGITGCRDIPTPHIDRLAAQGVFFTQSYANGAICSPTRVALMTGQYQHRTGNDDLPNQTGSMPLHITTLPERLRAVGYRTGMVGKWHLGSGDGYDPLDRGFDEFYGFLGGGHNYFPTYPPPSDHPYELPIYRNKTPSERTDYLTDAFGEEAVAFLERNHSSGRPLFLYLAFNAVHDPMQAKPEDVARFASIPDEKRRTYAGMLHAMDEAIGAVLKAVEDLGMADNTLIVFHNDNGGPTTRNAINGSSNAPFRGSKGETFEGGIRVPSIASWPGIINKGTEYTQPIMTFDFTATLLSVGGADMTQLDGVNILPFLSGAKAGAPHQALFWRARPRNNNFAVLEGTWKYVRSTEGPQSPQDKGHQFPRHMLFNLAEDPHEKNDLSGRHPEILSRLRAMYDNWDSEMDRSCFEHGLEPPRASIGPP